MSHLPRGGAWALTCFLLFSAGLLRAQPVVHLDFNNPGQLGRDVSGNNRHGNARGNAAHTNNGVAGGAAVFDGSTAVIDIEDETVASTLSGNFTISLWVATTQTTETQNVLSSPALVAAGNSNSTAAALGLAGNGVGFANANSQASVHSQSPVNSGNFTHVVITYDAATNTQTMWVNGSLEATAAGPGNSGAVHTLLALGLNPGQGQHFAGAIDDFQLYNRAVNASEVALLHANPGSAVGQLAAIPEPSTLVLLASGLAALGVLQWRRRFFPPAPRSGSLP